MDPFEEFEFKPLTDGLGFHKKKSAAPAKNTMTTMRNQGLELLEEPGAELLRPPLPRKQHSSQPLPVTPGDLTEIGGNGSSSAAVDEILKTLQKNRRLDFEANTKKTTPSATAAATKDEYKKTSFSFSAAILDGMLIVAGSLLCMIILLVITKVDLIGNLTNPDAQGLIYLATASLVATVSFIYLTLNRIYLGWTPGEWAFDQRVGKPEELNTATYSLKVVARSLMVIFSGFVVLPILSFLFNKDIAGQMSGARLYKKA